jgi:hypothetical protein
MGALAPVVYLIAVLVGGYLWQGYSHYGETVSTLTSAGAPNQAVMVPLFAIYNIFVIALAAGLYLSVEGKKPRVTSALMAAAGIAGLVLFAFPQDYPQGPPVTFTGTMHVAVAGIIALVSLLAIAALFFELRHVKGWTNIAKISIIILPIAVVLGGFGAASITTAYAGLAERLSIGTILVWLEVVAVGVITRNKKRAPKSSGNAPYRYAPESTLPVDHRFLRLPW